MVMFLIKKRYIIISLTCFLVMLHSMEDQEKELFFDSIQGAKIKRTLSKMPAKVIDVHTKDSFGNTPLHVAANWGHLWGTIQEIEELIDAGADIDAINVLGKTPLHEAMNMDELDVARLLLDRGARTDIKSATNQTALEMADSQSKREFLETYFKSKK